ncbi:FadR family transcriptional regulator [Halioglobus maricola]|uniref:FadR family transcriptional regulator n=1 Tax=Halioglobus maricola TaxID=2601894 RepID=A0A5P9NHA8_9GAMM|nr:FadR/GntR family transcriptional regulator [Halioglobus maricola]QFU75181.1 FadR family transcriptional regulator [Halioglobus maricola]
MAETETNNRQRLYRQIVEQILQSIDAGEFPAGTRLPAERELSEKFGVSRPTVREAVIALEAMGRVSVKTGSGVYVLESKGVSNVGDSVSPFELLETRVLIEGEAAALAASMISDEQVEELKHALDDMARENESGNHQSDVADRAFHAVIAAATNNRLLTAMIENLWDVQEGQHHIRAAHHSVCKRDPEARLQEHQDIYDALSSRDPQAARTAMRNHFGRGINALHQRTEQEAVEAVQRELSKTRERFSLTRLNQTST